MGCGFYCEYEDKTRKLTDDEVLHMGRGTISSLEEEVNDRLDGALYGGTEDGIDGRVYSPEEVKEIFTKLDILEFLKSFKRKFRYWVVNGEIPGDMDPEWEWDEYETWNLFLALRKVFECAAINGCKVRRTY